MWQKKDFPLIPGYESKGDSVEAKRWIDFRPNQLFDFNDPIWEVHRQFSSPLKIRRDVCTFVISLFNYPMRYGQPTDKHYNNWFDGLCCHTITQDFWQTSAETIRTLRINRRINGKEKGYGDCEDTSVLAVDLFLMKGWPAYECLGYVMSKEGQILGGHGFSLLQFEDGSWHLYESTLATLPIYSSGYPEVDVDGNDWQVGNIIYHAIAKFNKEEYFEWDRDQLIGKYIKLGIKSKETRAKHAAISANWGIKTKPILSLGLLAKLRWRE